VKCTFLLKRYSSHGCNALFPQTTLFASLKQFRQEYRLEKKLLSELSIDPKTFPADEEDLSSLVAATTSTNTNGRHWISRVCIVYNDKLETFSNPGDFQSKASTQPLTASFRNQHDDRSKSGDDIPSDFFDNDSFWSGSLTWY
jgi:hypothetical protein